MIGCIIQARMKSCSLNGKILENIDENYTVLDVVINQVKKSKKIKKIVVATTNYNEDKPIWKHLESKKIEYYKGSNNIFQRYFECAKKFGFNKIIRIFGNHPFVDPEIIDKMILEKESNGYQFISNHIECTFPHGTEIEIFDTAILKNIEYTNLEFDNTDIQSIILKNNKLKIKNFKNFKNLSHLNYTVNTIQDVKVLREIMGKIPNRPIHVQDLDMGNN